MSGDILTVKTVKRVRSVRGSALVHIIIDNCGTVHSKTFQKIRFHNEMSLLYAQY